ncbi:hypothetical protein KKA27_01350 [Patescibacteria group bacterium]|nr:hypothetical protein [Patescibacteria group bacterium]MBU2633056.1 hypothetical protein [Patescibacteria group bacterium]
MEEERKYSGQKPWRDAGFKTEDKWLDFWVSVLEEAMKEVQLDLNKLRKETWKFEVQMDQFVQSLCEWTDRDHDRCSIARVVCSGFFVFELRGYDGKFYRYIHEFPSVKNFLLSYSASGKKWYEVARETDIRIQEILVIAKRIQRNILYPEVEEMERRIESLESREMYLKELLDDAHRKMLKN